MSGGADTYDRATIMEIGRFGLGSKRTLDQLIAFMGVDLRGGKIFGNRCKTLEWIPFVADAGTVLYCNTLTAYVC
jgi:hypothetical protein